MHSCSCLGDDLFVLHQGKELLREVGGGPESHVYTPQPCQSCSSSQWKMRKDMSRQSSNKFQIPVRFKDVAACFSEEEWKLLHEREKSFYRSVMEEIHQTLITLGYQIRNPKTLVRVIKCEDVYQGDPRNPKSGADHHDPTPSHDLAIDPTPDIFLRIQYEEEQSCRDMQSSEETEIGTVPMTGPHLVTPDLPLQIKEEDELCSRDADGRDAVICDPGYSAMRGREWDRYTSDNDSLSYAKVTALRGRQIELNRGHQREEMEVEQGHQRIHPETLLHVNKWEDSAPTDAKDSKSRADLEETTFDHPPVSPISDAALRDHHAQEQCGRDVEYPEEGKISNSLGIDNLSKTMSLQPHPGKWNFQREKRNSTDEEHDQSTELMKKLVYAQNNHMSSIGTECEKHLIEPVSFSRPQSPLTKAYKCTHCDESFIDSSQLLIHNRSHVTEESFVCNTCGKCFSNWPSLITHKQLHIGSEVYKCMEYENIFSRSSEVCSHQSTHTGEKSSEYTECKEIFNESSSLMTNQETSTSYKPYECSECKKGFNHCVSLINHQRIHTGNKPFRCTECKNTFNSLSALKVHQMNHTGEKPFECSECKKSFSRSAALVRHQRIHTGEKPYKCTECKKSFNDLSALKVHHRIHTGEKPFECRECKKRFTDLSGLKGHQRVHTGEKPYACTWCKKPFRKFSYMKTHERIHTGEKPYECVECRKSFHFSSGLKSHQRHIHARGKPHECTECRKSFRVSSALIKHQRIHTGERPYKCTVCEKAFTNTSALKVHHRVHTGEMPYECTECRKTFCYASALKSHQRQFHAGVSLLSAGKSAVTHFS